MPDNEPLFELKENLYRESCPVLLESGALFDGEETLTAEMTFRSLDDRAITALFFDVHAFDVANNEVEVLRDRRCLVPVVGRDGTFQPDVPVTLQKNAHSFSVAIKRVEFEGEDVWKGSASLLFERIPTRRPLNQVLSDEKLAEQFRRDFVGDMAENERGLAQYMPEVYKDLWLCACGGVNRSGEEKCFVCGAPFAAQLELAEDEAQLQANLEAFEKAEAEKAEAARIAAEEKAAAEKAAAEEAERLRIQAEAEALEAANKRRLHRKIFLSISIPLVTLLAIFAVVLVTYILPEQKYAAAVSLLEAGQYDDAGKAFLAMDGYADSKTRATEASYRKGAALLESGKPDEAITTLQLVADYEDAAELILKAQYMKAVKAMEAGAYEDALKQLQALEGYGDTPDKIEECYFNMAKNAAEADNAVHAAAYLESVFGARNLELQEIFCTRGTALYEAGELEAGEAFFMLVTDEALLKKVDAAYYAHAKALVADDKLTHALEVFESLGDFEDSAEQAKQVHRLLGDAHMNAGEYKDAIAAFEKADADGRILDATYEYGVQLLNNGQVTDSYNTLYPIRHDDRAFALLVSDSRYYIYIYEAGIGSNPLDE